MTGCPELVARSPCRQLDFETLTHSDSVFVTAHSGDPFRLIAGNIPHTHNLVSAPRNKVFAIFARGKTQDLSLVSIVTALHFGSAELCLSERLTDLLQIRQGVTDDRASFRRNVERF